MLFDELIEKVGTITGSSQGAVEFERSIVVGDREIKTMRSTKFKKFRAGERVAVTLSVGDNNTTLIRVKKIIDGRSYGISLIPGEAVDQTGVFAQRIAGAASDLIGAEVRIKPVDIVQLFNATYRYWIAHNMTYNAAQNVLNKLKRNSDMFFSETGMEVTFAINEAPTVMMTGITNSDEWINDHYIPENVRPVFSFISDTVGAGLHVDMMIRGASGYGKTSLMKALANQLGFNYVRINCPLMQETADWFGKPAATDGTTYTEEQLFAKAVQTENTIIVLDEVNRIPPHISNALFPLLDDERATEYEGTVIKRAPNVIIAMTANEGWQYSGTYSTDAAFTNRPTINIEIGPPPLEVERMIIMKRYKQLNKSTAADIVDQLRTLRKVAEHHQITCDVSTRSTLKVAQLVAYGMKLHEAIRVAVVNAIDSEDRKPFIDILQSIH